MTSELASFVAAVLRDSVVSELEAELKSLRDWKHESETMRITGPDCTPVYARGHLKENGDNHIQVEFREPMWKVRLSKIGTCPLKDSAVEVWMGNVRLCSCREFASIGAGLDKRRGTLTWQFGRRDDVDFMVRAAIDGHTEQSMRFIQNGVVDEMNPFEVAKFARNNLADVHPFLECNFDLLLIKRSIFGGHSEHL